MCKGGKLEGRGSWRGGVAGGKWEVRETGEARRRRREGGCSAGEDRRKEEERRLTS